MGLSEADLAKISAEIRAACVSLHTRKMTLDENLKRLKARFIELDKAMDGLERALDRAVSEEKDPQLGG